MATMPSAEVLREDIEACSMWRSYLMNLPRSDGMHDFIKLQRLIVGGHYKGKVFTFIDKADKYFESGIDYEVALARLLAAAEARLAYHLESGDSETDDGNAHTAA